MRVSRSLGRLLPAMLLACAAPAANAKSPVIGARPSDTAPEPLQPGFMRLPHGATAYVPPSLAAGQPAPLVILLHGLGGSARGFIRNFTAAADARGFLLLSLQAAGETWDLVDSRRTQLRSSTAMRTPAAPRFGRDIERIDRALAAFFAKAPVDERRIALLGFSDGATYALSLGAANPQLFSTLIAFSPGFAMIPKRGSPDQRVFIAHGTADRILPFAVAQDQIRVQMLSAGMDVRFRPFEGGHIIDGAAAGEAFDFFLEAGATEPAMLHPMGPLPT